MLCLLWLLYQHPLVMPISVLNAWSLRSAAVPLWWWCLNWAGPHLEHIPTTEEAPQQLFNGCFSPDHPVSPLAVTSSPSLSCKTLPPPSGCVPASHLGALCWAAVLRRTLVSLGWWRLAASTLTAAVPTMGHDRSHPPSLLLHSDTSLILACKAEQSPIIMTLALPCGRRQHVTYELQFSCIWEKKAPQRGYARPCCISRYNSKL